MNRDQDEEEIGTRILRHARYHLIIERWHNSEWTTNRKDMSNAIALLAVLEADHPLLLIPGNRQTEWSPIERLITEINNSRTYSRSAV
jgi:hypothetical protein